MLKHLFSLLPAPIVRTIGDECFANLQKRGAISTWMVASPKNETDAEDWGDFDIDDFDFDPEAEISDTASTDAYIDRQISKIPQHGDGSRWRLADYLDMFGEDLDRSGTLTDEQREAVDAWVREYQTSGCYVRKW
jgi:hypothetical protein